MSANDVTKFQEAIAVITDTLRLDKADLQVMSVTGDTAQVNLLISKEACPECIMPKEVLAEMILMSAQESYPGISTVEVKDPREDGSVAAHH
jgi:hypothetical protein